MTSPARTLIDLARALPDDELEAAVNEADRRRLTRIDTLREHVASRRTPGTSRLRELLDARTFRLTESVLERRFLAIVRAEGLPLPQTQVQLGDARVDFFWPELGLVVETDGLAYHRTPASQQRDQLRDQAHLAAGRTPLRFGHAQIARDPDAVARMLKQVLRRLETERRRITLRA